MKIKKGDQVKIISGKDKGKQGKVLRIFSFEDKILVDGVNMKKKHQRPRRSNQKGQIIEFASPIHVSNAMLIDPKEGKPTRVGYELRDGKKVRRAKRSGSQLS